MCILTLTLIVFVLISVSIAALLAPEDFLLNLIVLGRGGLSAVFFSPPTILICLFLSSSWLFALKVALFDWLPLQLLSLDASFDWSLLVLLLWDASVLTMTAWVILSVDHPILKFRFPFTSALGVAPLELMIWFLNISSRFCLRLLFDGFLWNSPEWPICKFDLSVAKTLQSWVFRPKSSPL